MVVVVPETLIPKPVFEKECMIKFKWVLGEREKIEPIQRLWKGIRVHCAAWIRGEAVPQPKERQLTEGWVSKCLR